MNKENILKVADAIEQHSIPDLGFNMGYWVDRKPFPGEDLSGHNCGTTACIAGWAVAVEMGAKTADCLPIHSIRSDAQEFLGLGGVEAASLFEGFPTREVAPSHAIAVLRHLAETGEVDWNRAIQAAE